MRKSKRDLAFVAACVVVCLCVALNKGLMGLNLIPQKHESSLEGRQYERRPALTLDAVVEGTFQDSFERYVADGVPLRDGMVLANAAVQRSTIALSCGLFGYPAYPTFFGSGYAYAPEFDMIVPVALKRADMEAAYAQAHQTLASFAGRHPELELYVLEVDNPANSSANPTYGLVSDASGTGEMLASMRDDLPANVRMVGHACPDAEYLSGAYYRTDHHWVTGEAYRSYAEALARMMPQGEPVTIIDQREFDVGFLGSTTRAGLKLPNNPVPLSDYRIDMSTFSITLDGDTVDEDALDSWESYESNDFGCRLSLVNRYADYYHNDYGFLEIHNPDAQGDVGLLIVGNSYTNCMERFFAANYARVYKIDERHTDLLADDFLAEHPEVRHVLVVGQVGPILAGALGTDAA